MTNGANRVDDFRKRSAAVRCRALIVFCVLSLTATACVGTPLPSDSTASAAGVRTSGPQRTFDAVAPASPLCDAAPTRAVTSSPRKPLQSSGSTPRGRIDEFTLPGANTAAPWTALSWSTHDHWSGLKPPLKWNGGFFTLDFASSDGLSWRRTDIPVSGNRIVAPARGCLIAYPTSAGNPPVTSSDGVHWVQRGVVTGLEGLELNYMSDSPIAAGPEGYVALLRSDYGTVHWIATSRDGVRWSRSSPIDAPNPMLLEVYYQSGHFVLVSYSDGMTTVLISTDGTSWHTALDQPGQSQLVRTTGGLLLVSAINVANGDKGAEFSWSSDGLHWTEPADLHPFARSITKDDMVYAVPTGRVYSDGERAVAWGDDGKMWVSDDARTWRPLGGAIPNPQLTKFDQPLVFPRGVMVGDQYGAAS